MRKILIKFPLCMAIVYCKELPLQFRKATGKLVARWLIFFEKNVELTYLARKYLLKGDLVKFAECLDSAWRLKRNFSSMISSEHIDAIYEGALKNGALGGKLLGAGGGGFFIFYVPPFRKNTLITYLKSNNLRIQPFRFEPDGLKTWTSREHVNHAIGK